jgi:outer membrane protein OmpA-like peptidoglycan-associated protein
VAIATALMPPLTTAGYSIAVARWDFAGGALLLFLTNLAAISFSFALVARIRGVARPLARIEFRWRYVVIGVLAFLVLATPLGLTLRRLARETSAAIVARQEISRVLAIDSTQIAQLSTTWTNTGAPHIVATVITPRFEPEADARLRDRIESRLGADVDVRLQQIVASDPREQTQAVIDAAIASRQLAAVDSSRAAPIESMRRSARFRTLQTWTDPNSREISLMAAPQDGWSVRDYRAEEARLSAMGFGWRARVIPPYIERAPILFGDDQTATGPEQLSAIADITWALQRWGVRAAVVDGLSGSRTGATRNSRVLAETRAATVAAALTAQGVATSARVAETETSGRLAEMGPQRVRAADVLPFAEP